MRRILSFALALAWAAVSSADLLEHYQRGVAASEAGDRAGYLEAMDRALEIAPAHPILLRHRAQALAGLDRLDDAMAALEKIVAVGAHFEFADIEAFAPLLERADWTRFAGRVEEARRPEGSMRLGFVVGEADLVPEGIAYDPIDDVFYLSSVAKRKIVRATRDGRVEDFIATDPPGYYAGLGLALDAERRRLWAVSDAAAAFGLFEEDVVGRSAVHAFDLRDGALLAHVDFAPDENGQEYSLNDVALLPDGDVLVGASARGSLHRVGVDGRQVEILPAGAARGLNGLAISADGSEAYLSVYILGIHRVNLTTGALRRASDSPEFTTMAIDGLYRRGDTLVAVQNFVGLDRVATFAIGADGQLTECRSLVARQPEFVDPTTGAIVGDELWFIADSYVAPFQARADPDALEGIGTTRVMRVRL